MSFEYQDLLTTRATISFKNLHEETMVDRLYASPLGPLRLSATDKGLVSIAFVDAAAPIQNKVATLESALSHLALCKAQLEGYFKGTRRSFSIPLDLCGTAFEHCVWEALCEIPYGQTRSYADIARYTGRAKAGRAVGNANGKNPLPIVIPCHRVIASDGSLGGYSSGLWRKAWLLAHEGKSDIDKPRS